MTNATIELDAKGEILGRLATKIASFLLGKDRIENVPNLVFKREIIVRNCSQIQVTGRKLTQKIYSHPTGYLGNLKQTSLKELLEKKPTEPLRLAVKRMLPKNKLQSKRMNNLKLYP